MRLWIAWCIGVPPLALGSACLPTGLLTMSPLMTRTCIAGIPAMQVLVINGLIVSNPVGRHADPKAKGGTPMHHAIHSRILFMHHQRWTRRNGRIVENRLRGQDCWD